MITDRDKPDANRGDRDAHGRFVPGCAGGPGRTAGSRDLTTIWCSTLRRAKAAADRARTMSRGKKGSGTFSVGSAVRLHCKTVHRKGSCHRKGSWPLFRPIRRSRPSWASPICSAHPSRPPEIADDVHGARCGPFMLRRGSLISLFAWRSTLAPSVRGRWGLPSGCGMDLRRLPRPPPLPRIRTAPRNARAPRALGPHPSLEGTCRSSFSGDYPAGWAGGQRFKLGRRLAGARTSCKCKPAPKLADSSL